MNLTTTLSSDVHLDYPDHVSFVMNKGRYLIKPIKNADPKLCAFNAWGGEVKARINSGKIEHSKGWVHSFYVVRTDFEHDGSSFPSTAHADIFHQTTGRRYSSPLKALKNAVPLSLDLKCKSFVTIYVGDMTFDRNTSNDIGGITFDISKLS